MGHIKFDKGTRSKQNWKGFYLALAICLVAIGGIGVATFVASTPDLEQDKSEISSTVSEETETTEQGAQVNEVVTGVPDDRTTQKATTTKTTENDIDTAASAADLFILPLSNEVIREYSDNQLVFSSTMNDWRVHNGVDFKGEENQAVKALADGKILSIENDAFWGDTVTIDHGYGVQSHYCGVKVTSLKVGDSVKVGSTIGTLTEIPCEASDGPHLHLEILSNNKYVNPVEAIGLDVKTPTTSAAG